MRLSPSVARACLLGGAAAASIALAGCGSSSGGSGAKASTKAYAADVNAFCKDVKSATTDFQQAATKLGSTTDPSKAARTFGTALEQLADGFRSGTDRLREADPPARYESFNSSAVKALDQATARLRTVADSAKTGDVDALSKIGSQLGDLKVPDGPTELQAQAPDCRA